MLRPDQSQMSFWKYLFLATFERFILLSYQKTYDDEMKCKENAKKKSVI